MPTGHSWARQPPKGGFVKKEDYEDFQQFKALKRLEGRKASNRELEIDFIRQFWGRDDSCDAMFKERLGGDVIDQAPDEYDGGFDAFIDRIEDMNLSQRIIMSFVYCGITINQLKKILKTHHISISHMLKGLKSIRTLKEETLTKVKREDEI
jgi:hypothetical protein